MDAMDAMDAKYAMESKSKSKGKNFNAADAEVARRKH